MVDLMCGQRWFFERFFEHRIPDTATARLLNLAPWGSFLATSPRAAGSSPSSSRTMCTLFWDQTPSFAPGNVCAGVAVEQRAMRQGNAVDRSTWRIRERLGTIHFFRLAHETHLASSRPVLRSQQRVLHVWLALCSQQEALQLVSARNFLRIWRESC
jgi:hypothetical protein